MNRCTPKRIALKEVFLLLFAILCIYKVSGKFEMSVNGFLMPCEKKSKFDVGPPYHIIENCHRKIRLVINIENSEKTPDGLSYIYVKEVTHSKMGVKHRLLHPIVLQLKQDQVVLAYPFKYLSAVNGKVSEFVVNRENRQNYTGCDDTSTIQPTCGLKFERGSVIPFSEGFCCFCPEKPSSIKQPRGGQDCSLEAAPEDFEMQKYKASAHCLHFHDIWYSVSALDDPMIIHNIFLQVFNQRHFPNGSSLWVSLTNDEALELSPKNPSHYNDNKTFVATFMTANPKNGTAVIPIGSSRLLIPQPMAGIGVDKLPAAVKNGANDYILLSKNLINSKGTQCDRAGVSYEGFVTQRSRCKVANNTCLKNQPLDFWEEDEKKRQFGQKGKYLLYNYGTPNKDPILIDQATKEHSLALEYYEKQLTVVTVEFAADDIVALTIGKDVHITTVVTASHEKKIIFIVTLSNNGLVEAAFSVKATSCEFNVPNSNTATHTILPQLMEEFELVSTPGAIELTESFFCTIVVTTKLYNIVAKRKVTIKPLQRCVCNWHCQCACIGEGFVCNPMSEEDFHEAGFKGSLPVLTAKPPYRPWIVEHPFLAICAVLLILLIIGVIKSALGLIGYEKIGNYGLENRIYRPGEIKHYTEPDIRHENVVYDEEGYPIHPELKYRTKSIPQEILCILNILFCFIWPCKSVKDHMTERAKRTDKSPTKTRRFGRRKKKHFGTDEDEDESETIKGRPFAITKVKKSGSGLDLESEKRLPIITQHQQGPVIAKKKTSKDEMHIQRFGLDQGTYDSSRKALKASKSRSISKLPRATGLAKPQSVSRERRKLKGIQLPEESVSDSVLTTESSEIDPEALENWKAGAFRAAAFDL